MSQLRKIELKEVNLSVIVQCARELGYSVLYNTFVKGWGGVMPDSICDVVIDPHLHNGYTIGFRKHGDSAIERIEDTHANHTIKAMKPLMTRYQEATVKRMLERAGKRFDRIESDRYVTLKIKV